MDMSMPKLNGVEATRIIHNDWPEIRIVGLSMFEEADRAQAMRDAGAVNYVTKSGPAEELINAIRTSVRASNKVLSATSQN
jgi:DNA-binding NarL/FixJ family response regulator